MLEEMSEELAAKVPLRITSGIVILSWPHKTVLMYISSLIRENTMNNLNISRT